MDKKTALIILLENSFIVPDKAKVAILKQLDKLPSAQIDALGKLLAQERELLLKDKDAILKRAKLLLDTIELVV
ncbi:hypothetical protein HZC27_01685 [Candidatus Roizmanbacteria bacterium]|nr:hypothetical protein [Candidatus Roizmanbacteria bacterium]